MGHTELFVNCEEEMTALGQDLAKDLKPGVCIALRGDLGAGKSVLARGIIRALAGSDIEVPSPTFTLVQTYDTPVGEVHHYDLYRLEDPEEVFELGWEESLAEALCLIEWPDKAGPYLPSTRIDITITKTESDTARKVEIVR